METENQKPHINVDFFEDLTGDIIKSDHDKVEDIGKRVRTLREEKGLSLDELSKLTGFDIEFLFGIERAIEWKESPIPRRKPRWGRVPTIDLEIWLPESRPKLRKTAVARAAHL